MARIKYKPKVTVSGLGAPAMEENTHKLNATWSIPSALKSGTARATTLAANWVLTLDGANKTISGRYGITKTAVSINLDGFKIGDTQYNRSKLYPNGEKLTAVTIRVGTANNKGWGKVAAQTRNFGVPNAPEIDEISFNTKTGMCTATVKVEAGDAYHERYDTKYRVTVRDRNGNVSNTSDSASTSTEFNLNYDAQDYQNLENDQYIQVTVAAYNRGYAGDSKEATRNLYISYPSKATIKGVSISSKDSTGKMTAIIDTNETKEHPVDKVTLEYLANVTYEEESDIPARDEWTDSGIEDNGNCTAIAMPVGALVPDRGRYTWIRVKTVHAHEGLLYRYSNYVRLRDLETPPAEAAEDDITILSAKSGANGESAVVLLGWNRSGTDDSTGTELSWADEEDTWKSTKEPENYEFTWSDGAVTHGSITYHDSAEITIKGLSEGKKYYIRARRYYEGETTSYGRYSNMVTIVTSEKPAGVVANCSKYIAAGEPLPVYWSFSGNGIQTEWQIVSSDGTIIANGEGSLGGTQISANRLAALATNNTISFTVQVSTGSGYVSSEIKTVTILEHPTLTVAAPATLTAQPYSFTATSSRLCDLIVVVTSQGASGQFPQGFRMQTAGDTVYSDILSPTWSNGSATITLPSGLDFWDLGNYTLNVVAIDRETKLRSGTVEKSFKVDWTNKAVNPDEFITLTPIDTRSEDGEHLQGVQIDLTPPTGSNETDVYDIYRMDGDNPHLIGEGFPLTYSVTDEYAPFGDDEDLRYRIALRTVDGSVDFAEKDYVLASNTVRIDWSGGSLELPYGLSIGDNYKKSVEFRQHMDGSVDGYWNQNIERGASYSSSIIKLIQPEEINLARALARYAGAVFVRTSNGSAFSADVQITDLSVKNKAVTAIAIDATEVGLTEEFMLPSPYEQEDE